ncbi:response regulator [Sphingomonas nostoxanthinifaciens]|uniref:response regulator n=1 Tax=Sphingomonas nostoxanthinifaciens TaxID=2872652 RepID=UPI001CC1FC5A|nr:response regulator [Sphingomonas nostoxanthinifaciens]UAK23066.1 response regulator [Sphingomonas nostoxanthinifaciens]
MAALRVLVIDDSLTIRGMIEHLVQRDHVSRVVGMAADGRGARAMIEDLAPNVITLDLDMPGLDGFSLLGELRGRPHAPVVVVSSATRCGSAASREVLDRGAAAWFDKAHVMSDADGFIRLLHRMAARKSRRSLFNGMAGGADFRQAMRGPSSAIIASHPA